MTLSIQQVRDAVALGNFDDQQLREIAEAIQYRRSQIARENKRKEVEVATAKLEAERIAALNANAGATKYMEATAIVTIAEAVKEGKVKTIVVPYDFKGIINTGN